MSSYRESRELCPSPETSTKPPWARFQFLESEQTAGEMCAKSLFPNIVTSKSFVFNILATIWLGGGKNPNHTAPLNKEYSIFQSRLSAGEVADSAHNLFFVLVAILCGCFRLAICNRNGLFQINRRQSCLLQFVIQRRNIFRSEFRPS